MKGFGALTGLMLGGLAVSGCQDVVRRQLGPADFCSRQSHHVRCVLTRPWCRPKWFPSLDKLYVGLGGRRRLAPGTGMLFMMPSFEVQQFCMRGMLISIDIIWIAQDRIIGFHKNLSPKDPGTFTSPAPADVVLEVPAGFVASAGLRIGDRLQRLQ